MKNFKALAAFVSGAALGSFITWSMVKDYYEAEKDSYVQSVINRFTQEKKESTTSTTIANDNNITITPEPTIHDTEDTDMMTYALKITESEYNDYSEISTPIVEKESLKNDVPWKKPYIIPPSEFGDMDNYDNVTLYYHSDDSIVTDTDGNLITDLADTIGADSLNHFGEYEDDSVYVRNENTKCDYEILLDP